jgi:hypothetical protein
VSLLDLVNSMILFHFELAPMVSIVKQLLIELFAGELLRLLDHLFLLDLLVQELLLQFLVMPSSVMVVFVFSNDEGHA